MKINLYTQRTDIYIYILRTDFLEKFLPDCEWKRMEKQITAEQKRKREKQAAKETALNPTIFSVIYIYI